MRRVVVTGVGLVTPLGTTAKRSWQALLNGQSGVASWECCFDGKPLDVGSRVAARVDSEALEEALAERNVLTNARAQGPKFIQFALCAAHEAWSDSGLSASIDQGEILRNRVGVAIGSGIGNSVEEVAEAYEVVAKRGIRRLSPYFVPRLLVNLAAGHVAIHFGLHGPNHSASTACATGAHSIGDAYRMIMHGDADAMLAGGTESSMHALSFAGFSRLKALSTKYNDTPQVASRPFDKERDGFVMGEGAGVVVLEEYESAKRRGAKIYAEVKGYGMSGDAFHLTAPSEDGRGATDSMRHALKNSGLSAEHVDYINAHATSTPLGDVVEAEAIARVFSHRPAVSSTKGSVGHLLGAAGAVEAIFAILSVQNDIVPPTINFGETDIEEDVLRRLDLVVNEASPRTVRAAMSNSFGFGGTNCSLLFSKPN